MWERTGLNYFEQGRLPSRVMRGYRLRYRAGVSAANGMSENGAEKVLARGW